MQDVITLFDPDNDGEINYREFRELFYSISIDQEKTRVVCDFTNKNLSDNDVEMKIVPSLMRDEYVASLENENEGRSDNLLIAQRAVFVLTLTLFIYNNDRYSALKLSHNNIGDEGVKEICGAIMDDKSQCEIIDLRNNKITQNCCEMLGNALGTNVYVSKLYLSHNEIGGDGAAKVSERSEL